MEKKQSTLDIEKIKGIISERGLKQSWLAEKCGVSPNTISALLTGKRDVSKSVKKLMAIALDFELSELSHQQEAA